MTRAQSEKCKVQNFGVRCAHIHFIKINIAKRLHHFKLLVSNFELEHLVQQDANGLGFSAFARHY